MTFLPALKLNRDRIRKYFGKLPEITGSTRIYKEKGQE